jgi:hypothetical protein
MNSWEYKRGTEPPQGIVPARELPSKNKIKATEHLDVKGFNSEMEFFLHYLWSRSDYFQNETLSKMQADHEKPYEHLMRYEKTAKYAAKIQNVKVCIEKLSNKALSFIFKIPQTVIIKDGLPAQWYYSNEMRQIKLQTD